MSPRPRKVTDDELFAATAAVMRRVPPRDLTLAAIAREAGVTAAVLVQRFGSKRELLLTLMQRLSEHSGEMVAAIARQHASPLAALRGYAACCAEMAATPAAYFRTLSYLQIDVSDPDLRPLLLRHARATRRELRRLVQRAVEAGELRRDTPSGALARTIEAVISGSLLSWAIYQEGRAATWLRADLDAVMQPYVDSAPARRK